MNTSDARHGTELVAALEVPGLLMALKGKVVTADARHCNRRAGAVINAQNGDWCRALKAQSGFAVVGCLGMFRQAG